MEKPRKVNPTTKKRVAVYIRIATRKQAMPNTLDESKEYYPEYIASHPDRDLTGIYIDEGFSGTKDNHPDFQRLLADCRARKIDLLMTKSMPYATPLNPKHNKEP